MKFPILSIGLAAVVLAGGAVAQGTSRVAVHTDWTVFEAGRGGSGFADCWSASVPRASVNTKGGKTVDVRRGEIQLMVAFTRGSSSPQVAFTGGYPYGDAGTVTVEVDGKKFTLMTQNQPDANGETTGWAWPRDPGDEPKIIDAMRRGSEAVLSGQSSRGTSTKDTFSLLGFTAALDEAQRRCSN